MASAPVEAVQCRNCNSLLYGEYCAACGQRHAAERLRIRDWITDVVGSIVNYESRVLHTVVELTQRPSQMARDYIDGRRVRFVNPARYALATCALWWFAVSLQPGASNVWWVEYGQFLNLASVPLLALMLQLAFVGSRRNFAEHLAFLLFISGQAFLWRALLALIVLIFAPLPRNTALMISSADSILFVLYLIWALWGLHHAQARLLALRIFGAIVGVLIMSTAINLALAQFDRN